MRLPREIEELDLVGGSLAVDFVNTADSATPQGPITDDHIRNFELLVGWAQRIGLVDTTTADLFVEGQSRRPQEAAGVHREALELRDALYDLLKASAVKAEPRETSEAVLRNRERDALGKARLVWRRDRWRWEWGRPNHPRDILWPIVHSGSDLLTSEAVNRLRLCRGCRWLFMDLSRNSSRRWCTMAGCGNRAKARRFAARRRATRGDQ